MLLKRAVKCQSKKSDSENKIGCHQASDDVNIILKHTTCRSSFLKLLFYARNIF